MTTVKQVLLVLQLLALVVSLPMQVAARCHFKNANFGHSCKDISLEQGHILHATCGTGLPDRPWWVSFPLDLNEKVINDDGVLGCAICYNGFFHFGARDCNFSQSCQNMFLSGTVLFATCMDRHNRPIQTSLDLNDCVENGHGNLTWMCQAIGV